MKPLSVGEILEQAFALYLRVPVPSILLGLLMTVPVFFVIEPMIGALNDALSHHVITGAPHSATAFNPALNLAFWASSLLTLAVGIALTRLQLRAYLGHSVAWPQLLAGVRQRFLSVLGLIIVEYVTFFIAWFAITLAVGFLGFIFGALLHSLVGGAAQGWAVSMMVLVAFMIVLAALPLVLFVQMAWVRYATEEPPFFPGLILPWKMTFARSQFWHSYLATLMYICLIIGVEIIGFAIGTLVHLVLPSVAILLVLGLLLYALVTPLVNAFFVVYFVDARLRLDGGDVPVEVPVMTGAIE